MRHLALAGPVFSELDESLQAAFYNHLNEIGVDDELATTLADYSSNKEQVEYQAWLRRVHAFAGGAPPAITDGKKASARK